MKKLMILCAACLMALCAMAQIDAVKVTQGETTDWYPFGNSNRIDVILDDLGNPVIEGKIYDLSKGNVETEFGTAPVEKITLTAADFTVTKDGDWVYDQTEKRVNVEFISVENPGPPADKVEIYYNNDLMVKPINPGTYQVYIDIRETDTYAAVTGITSEEWKFDITMPTFVDGGLKFEVTSLDPKTVKVIANDYTGSSFTIPATVSYLEDDYAVTAIGENAFAGVGTVAAPADLLLPADWEGTKPAATATLWYGGYFVDYRAATIAAVKAASDEAENSIEGDATGFVGIEDVKQAKANAASALANAQATADNTIGAAADMIAIVNAKDDAIDAIQMATDAASVAIEAAIVSFKEGTIDEIEYVATHNKNSILEYAVADQVKETARNEIDKAVAEAEASINNADSEEQVNDAKNDAQNKINQQLAYVQNYYNQLQAAIAEIKYVANDAKEEIDGLGVDESAKSEAKAQIDNIAHTAEQTINAATSKDAIDNAKTEAITDIYNVVQTTKDMWVIVRENMTINTYGTLCWKYNFTAIEGAELYSVAGMENNRIILQEVLAEETQAGAGYVILATAETLRIKNGTEHVDTPLDAAACNGLQGTFEGIADGAAGADGNTLEGNYIIYQNEWRKCGAYTGLLANRAYLMMNYVPNNVPPQAPNRKYISMPLPKTTPTGEWRVENGEMRMDGKYIINGRFIIIKNGEVRDIMGNYVK